MTEAPQFQVFLKYNRRLQRLKDSYPDGLPCCKFMFRENINNPSGKNVFVVDDNLTDELTRAFIYDAFDIRVPPYKGSTKMGKTAIPLEQAYKVLNSQGKELPLTSFNLSEVLAEKATTKKIEISLSNEKFNDLILGLQQSLFVDPVETMPSFNDRILALTCELIEIITEGKFEEKEVYYYGFPCEYLKTAKKLLFPE